MTDHFEMRLRVTKGSNFIFQMNILKYLEEKHSKLKTEHMPCIDKPLGIYSRKLKIYLPVLNMFILILLKHCIKQ